MVLFIFNRNNDYGNSKQSDADHKDVQEGASNEWLEPVADEHYNKLK